MKRENRFAAFVWVVLAFNLLVILWGAVVRATGSGAGCGAHWPLCNGQVIPQAPALATFIEFFHRLTSAAALILVIAMAIASQRMLPRGHPARISALVSAILIVFESLIGMLIVMQQLTAKDSSAARAAVIAVHQANTLLLLGAITLTGWWASGGARPSLGSNRGLTIALVAGVVGLIALGATGAITALGDTLFPAASLASGLQEKFNPAAHFLVRLRLVHPSVAVAMGIYVAIAAWLIHHRTRDPFVKWMAASLTGLFLAQCALGMLNVVLLAPVWMQLAHLLMADAVWISFVLLAASALGPQQNLASAPAQVKFAPSQ